MNIIEIKRHDDYIYIFTEDIENDIKTFKELYKKDDCSVNLWYSTPEISNYIFLWKEYKCILLWYDYETYIAKESESEIFNLIT